MSTPDDFARLLGITSEPDGWNDEPFTKEEHEALNSFDTELWKFKKAKCSAFWSEFAASYLPQIVESYYRRSSKLSDDPSMSIGMFQYTRWMTDLAWNASGFPHFVQTREASAVALWMKVTEEISLLDLECIRDCFDIEVEFEEDTIDMSDRFLDLLRLWGELHHLIVGYLPYGSILPCFDPPTTARLSALLPSLSLLEPHWKDELFFGANFENLVSYHEVMMVPQTIFKVTSTFREGWMGGESTFQWWWCESLVDLTVGKKNPCFAGTRADSREEMLECSRCLSVRYCSTAHQKIHWKHHKKVCFKPLW